MDEPNNKLEDFFNQSLNQFDDSPSDVVWEGLQKRMDGERTILEKWTTAMRKIFPYLLLLVGLGTYHFYSQNKISQLRQNLESIKSENTTLVLNLSNCNAKESTLLTEKQLLQEALNTQTSSIAILKKTIDKYSSQRNEIHKPKSNDLASPVFSNKNSISEKSLPTFERTMNQNLNIESKFVDETKTDDPKVGLTNLGDTQTLKPIPKVASDQEYKNVFGIVPLRSKNLVAIQPRFNVLYNNTLMRGLRIEQAEKVEESNFRIGYQSSAFKTFTEIKSSFNFGNAHGIRMEKGFKNNFAITASVNFVDQKYKIVNEGNPIPVDDLFNYPGGVSFGDNVTSLEVESHHLNLPIGLKWTVRELKNNFLLYVNPSVVWQLYFPQEFTYEISGSSKINRENKQFFGNFGSGNLQIGLEKELRKNLIWQFGIFGERTIAPVGVENQNFTFVGLNSSILFQN